ncbi:MULTISPECIES: tRNA (guanosine(46)-N7)-methyltransferase TrmB [unclassified Sulfurospirillum]|uniref:tRNA (guanosine(46)-N7)-methyltransferase TrmB n=1 Tax=unclassified Sulfurospirillum TaxID=2618290 RepID=UPI0005024878|nr:MULTISPECIES: tRNA (guanosine(46)-N7)-methyltransferase TrmB [unclassified Sulfurospirillum]KFL34851.1 tRNA (guanine-N7)-methyltransferase [Sulfurospirillum sp. SCADC]
MPNFHTKTLKPLGYPCTYNETTFTYEAHSKRGNTLVMASTQGEQVLIRIQQKEDGVLLVKGDKVTRPTQASFLQKVLIDFRDASEAEEIFTNIEPKKFLHVKHSPYLKEIEFFANHFDVAREIWVEIGFGSGRHLLHQAKKNPHIQFIGLEIHKPSIEQVLKQCELQTIENILVIDYDARLFMEFLPSNVVGRIFVHFPVPWDKKPHRRVFSAAFIEEALRVLHVKGTLELRTDSPLYFEFTFSQMMQLSKADVHVKKNADLEITSKYEDRWRKMEKDIYDVILTNEIEAAPIPKLGRLHFDATVNFAKIRDAFKDELLRGQGFFVHFEELFEINEKSGLIRLSFGANERNERCFIQIQEGKVTYLPETILATKSNVAAHTLIKEWFHGICD